MLWFSCNALTWIPSVTVAYIHPGKWERKRNTVLLLLWDFHTGRNNRPILFKGYFLTTLLINMRYKSWILTTLTSSCGLESWYSSILQSPGVAASIIHTLFFSTRVKSGVLCSKAFINLYLETSQYFKPAHLLQLFPLLLSHPWHLVMFIDVPVSRLYYIIV